MASIRVAPPDPAPVFYELRLSSMEARDLNIFLCKMKASGHLKPDTYASPPYVNNVLEIKKVLATLREAGVTN